MLRQIKLKRGTRLWAEDLGHNLARVATTPLDPGLGVGDVVLVNDAGYVQRVLWQQFAAQYGVAYRKPHKENFDLLQRAAHARDWVLSPRCDGYATLDCPDDADLQAWLVDAGVKARTVQLQNHHRAFSSTNVQLYPTTYTCHCDAAELILVRPAPMLSTSHFIQLSRKFRTRPVFVAWDPRRSVQLVELPTMQPEGIRLLRHAGFAPAP